MCTPKSPQVQYVPQYIQAPQQTVAAPTIADAKVQKTGNTQRSKTAALSKNNIRTSARGRGEEATTTKKRLLGE